MIVRKAFKKGLFENSGEDIQYYGIDALNVPVDIEDIKEDLGKNCLTDQGIEGVIIGIEVSDSFDDYYYIVYSPNDGKVYYELCNNAQLKIWI